MSFLKKLLDGVQVEWKTLGEVYKFQYGKGNTIPTLGGEYPVYGSNGIVGNHNEYNSEDSPVIGHIGAYAGIVNWGKGKHFVTYNGVICNLINEMVNPKYAYHQLLKQNFNSLTKNSSQPFVSYKELNNVIIPIPPLEIQQKIVTILETFTEVTAELTAELTARKQQYAYYREKLLSFDEGEVQFLPMDDERVGEFQRGKRFVKTDLLSEGIPTIHYGEMYTYYGIWANETKSFVSKDLVKNKNLRIAQKGDVVIVAAGETVEDIGKGTAWLGNQGVVIHDACFSYKTSLNPKFVAYFTRTKQFHDQIKKHISSGKISAINAKGLGKTIIPIPSPEEQERIVSILDKFDILTNSISEGLPKEIELRKQQYEYYRDLLLTFPKDEI